MKNEIETQESKDDRAYPATNYKKTLYTFSQTEQSEMKPLEDVINLAQTFLAIGQITQRSKDAYVNSQVLSRLGVKRSEDIKFNYDLANNKIIVYEPRQWCSECKEKKAEFKYQDKIYCQTCIDKIKQELGKPLDKKEEKLGDKIAEKAPDKSPKENSPKVKLKD